MVLIPSLAVYITKICISHKKVQHMFEVKTMNKYYSTHELDRSVQKAIGERGTV